MTIIERLTQAAGGRMGLCVGLDPVRDRIPAPLRDEPEALYRFCVEIAEATSEFAAAYKPNLAFFEAEGASGWRQLERLIAALPRDRVVIADAKRGDIGNTAQAYAKSLFSQLKADMATVSPYLGADSLTPFLSDPEHGVFVLAVTSNPGGRDLQELVADGEPVFRHVIRLARRLNANSNVGLVVGATRSSLWLEVLGAAVDLPLLVPGVGAQGGDLKALKAAVRSYPAPVLVNASRSIIYASTGSDFTEAARLAARQLLQEFNS